MTTAGGPPEDEADFTDEPIAPTRPVQRQPAGAPTVELGGIARHREATRRWLAAWLVLLFAFLVSFSLCAAVFGWIGVDDLKSILEVLIPPVVALTGSALGFFFGAERGPSA